MAETFFDKVYKSKTAHTPDVLSCLANLSNDEVFTPPDVVNKMLDLLPQELFEDPGTTFLDPACKTGVFLREIAKRLIKGLEGKIPDLQKRVDHIMHKQLFGIAITELTSLLSRRSLYCSKYPNFKYSVSLFDNAEGNIRFRKVEHTWVNGKCKFCGANKKEYNRGEKKESYAYEYIHTNNTEKIFNMKFDVIISNPPYQLSDGGGTGDSARPIYQLFIEKALALKPKYVTMIVPSRWMKGGKGLTQFRQKMMNQTSIKYIKDFEDAKECFSGIHLDGGVCYFMLDSTYNGPVEYWYKPIGQEAFKSIRFLKNNASETIVRDYRQISIIEKAKIEGEEKFSKIVSYRNPYGLHADLFNAPEKYPEISVSRNSIESGIKVYGVKGIKGGAKRISGYIPISILKLKDSSIGKYKLFFSKAYMTTSTVPPEIILGVPNEACTETFLQIGGFDLLEYAKNCLNYIKTKFFRALLFYNRHSLNISKESFALIPMQDFTEKSDIDWSLPIPEIDKQLYEKYGLSQEEIDFIESMIKPME